METNQEIKFEQIIGLLDKKYYLYYVDYRDTLENSLDKVQEAIHGKHEAIDDMFMDWDTFEAEKEILNQLKGKMTDEFEIDDNEADKLIEKYEDDIKDEIRNRDESTPLKDIIRNTRDQVFFYDTGMHIDDYTNDLKERIKDCKRALKIAIKNKDHDKWLSDMCCNASYGGRLVVYFKDSLDTWMNIPEDMNVIRFYNEVTVAIVNNGNGSGGDTSIIHSFNLPFNRENLFLCRTVKYSYTYDVCGMSSDWCQKTNAELLKKKTKKKAEKSTVNDHIEKEKRLNETYKNGGCTSGDMNISRHRRTEYINNFPCGTLCHDCNTFWID
jgi:flagellar biosynthesis chaperone FliJ